MTRYATTFLSAALLFSGCSREPLVGFLGELSGASSELAVMGRDGARLFVEENGGRLLVCDTHNDPDTASRCVQTLADSGAVVIIGPMTSRTVDAAVAAAAKTNTTLVSPTVSSHLLTGKDDPFLRVMGSNLDQAEALADHLRARGSRSPLVFWERKNATYSEPIARRILERLDAQDSSKAHSIGYTTSTDLSFDSMIAPHPEADAYVIIASAMDAALLCKAVRRSGATGPLYGSQFAMGSDLLRIGGDAAEGMILAAAFGFAVGTPPRDSFQAKFFQRYHREPSFGAVMAWEAASVSRPGWTAKNGEQAKRLILTSPPSSPLGEMLRLDSNGDVNRRVVLHVVDAGRFRALP